MQNRRIQAKSKRANAAQGAESSLFEMMAVVMAVLGLSLASVQPASGKSPDDSRDGQSKADARKIASFSASLASIGIAHVFPKGIGGVEATIRLLREGVATSNEESSDKVYRIVTLSDEQVKHAAEHLKIASETDELRLVYTGG